MMDRSLELNDFIGKKINANNLDQKFAPMRSNIESKPVYPDWVESAASELLQCCKRTSDEALQHLRNRAMRIIYQNYLMGIREQRKILFLEELN